MSATLVSLMIKTNSDKLIEKAEETGDITNDEALDLFLGSQVVAGGLDNLWKDHRDLLDCGIERRTVLALLKSTMGPLAEAVTAFTMLLERLHNTNLLPQKALTILADSQQRFTRRQKELGDLVGWLEAPRAKIDISSLPRDSGLRDDKNYIPLKDVVDRLLSGSDS